jgi:hypothetical protein
MTRVWGMLAIHYIARLIVNRPKAISGTKKAKDEIRTRDPNLGKVMLYQLSYFRIQINLSRIIIFNER